MTTDKIAMQYVKQRIVESRGIMRSFINSIVADVNWASVDSGKEEMYIELENNGYFESVKNEKNQTIYKKAKQDKTEEVIPESMKRRYHEFYISFERIINKLFLLFEWKYGNGQDIENVSIEEKTSAVMEQLEDMGSGDSCLGFSELCEVIEKYMEAFRNGTSWTVVRKRENYGQRLYI